jgi:hypothetical protein
MLPGIAINGAIDRFLRRFPIRHRIKPRRFTRSRGPAPMHEIVSAVSMKRELVIGEKSPPLRVCRHGHSNPTA